MSLFKKGSVFQKKGASATTNGATKTRDARKKSKSGKRKDRATAAADRPIYTKADLMKSIPQFRDVTSEMKHELMLRKLRLCCVVFDFSEETNATSYAQENLAKEVKRQQLLELVDHVTSARDWFTEDVLVETLYMISANLFRSLPPSPYGEQGGEFDPEEDDPALDPQWPHLQLCYEYLLRFVVSTQSDVKVLRKHIDKRTFLVPLIGLFRSEDPRERDYLKTILHRIYGKFMAFRSFIRRTLNDVFYDVIYGKGKPGPHPGIAELLEILGSIINGFALPIKEEHKQFLKNVLIPLHKVPTLSQFSQQLAYCVTQFIDKDPALASTVIDGLLRFWPKQSAGKEQLYLNELEEVLENSAKWEIEKVLNPLFTRVARCVQSPHFQVAERALFLWNNDVIATFTSEHRQQILPILYPALNQNTKNHWNTTVHSLAFNIVRMFMEMDMALWETVSREHESKVGKGTGEKEKKEKRAKRWEEMRKLANQS